VPVVPINSQQSANMSTTVQQILDQCKLHTKLQNYFGVGNISGEPGMTIANRTIQMLLQRRMAWKFNRFELGPAAFTNGAFFVTQQGVQDIRHAGATIFALLNNQAGGGTLPTGGASIDLVPQVLNTTTYGPVNGGTAGITISGSTFTVQTIDPHPFQSGNIGQSTLFISGAQNPAFNSSFTWNSLTQSSAWVNGYAISAIPDQYHLVLTSTSGQYAPGVTHITQTGPNSNGQYTTVITVANTFSVGDIVTPTLGVNTVLNTQNLTLTAVSASTITFLTTSTVTAGAETGSISATQSGAPGIFNLGWLESASIQDMNSTAFPQPVKPINAVHRIAPEYTTTGDAIDVCALIDYNNGVIKFRLSQPMGTYSFQINLVYQGRAQKMLTTNAIFQWPDSMSYVLVDVALALASKFAYGVSAPETAALRDDASNSILMALASEDQEANQESIAPEMSLMR
jgi:hypothetical protein